MDKKIDSGIVKIAMVLLLIGVIVGLVFLYVYIDRNGIMKDVNADNDNGGHNQNIGGDENNDGNNVNDDEKDDDTEERPLRTIPRMAEKGILNIGGNGEDNAVAFEFMGKGVVVIAHTDSEDEDFKGNGNKNIALAYIEDKEIKDALTLTEKSDVSYVAHGINVYGLVIVARSASDMYIYRIGYDFRLVEKRIVKNIDDGRIGVLGGDTFNVVYRINGKLNIDRYDSKFDNKSISCIDIKGDIVAVYSDANSDICIVMSSGIIVKCNYDKWDSVKLCDGIDDISPFITEEKELRYAVIGTYDGVHSLIVYDKSFNRLSVTKTSDEKLIIMDKLYTYNSVDMLLNRRCKCGEVVKGYDADIESLIYADYTGGYILADDRDGNIVKITFDNENVSFTKLEHGYIYLSNEFGIYNDKGDIIVSYN